MSLRKMVLFGIGVVVLTQEKFEEFAQEMIIKGLINKEEGKKFVMEVLSEKDKQLTDIEEKINQKVKYAIDNAIDKSGISTRKDIQALEKRLELIEKNIAICEIEK